MGNWENATSPAELDMLRKRNSKSAQPCGCDEGADHLCEQHRDEAIVARTLVSVSDDNVKTKPSNPKDLIGSNKLPLHLWPETATAHGCLALLDGNLKYGRTNWRAAGVKVSIYVDACRRHLNEYFDEGSNVDKDSGLHPLAHALACLAILVDAEAAERLTDDRLIKGGYGGLVTRLTPHVARLKDKHKDKTPRHYTIADNAEFVKKDIA